MLNEAEQKAKEHQDRMIAYLCDELVSLGITQERLLEELVLAKLRSE
jgi:hypothetical protein